MIINILGTVLSQQPIDVLHDGFCNDPGHLYGTTLSTVLNISGVHDDAQIKMTIALRIINTQRQMKMVNEPQGTYKRSSGGVTKQH